MAQVCEIEEVVIKTNRQRREFKKDDLADLNESLDKFGLFHLPVCRREGGQIVLVSGERRYRVLMQRYNENTDTRHGEEWIGLGKFLYTDVGELSIADAEEAELDENIRRVDLTWQERNTAIARLHYFRKTQAERAGKVQTLSDTAAEIKGKPQGTPMGDAVGEVTQALILDRHLEDPDVATAKSVKEAMKVIQKKAEATKREELAAKFDLEYGPGTEGDEAVSRSLPHKLLIGSCLELLETLEPNTYSVLLTDPPYGIGADSFGEQSGEGHAYSDSFEFFQKFTPILAAESYRVCTAQAHAYVFCDPRRFADLELAFQLAGWYTWPTPLIWAKNGGMLPRPEHGPRRAYETILYCIKGDRKVLKVASDVMQVPMVRGLMHGAQKPVALYTELLNRSAYPGEKVLDPFCGSGTIFAACNNLRLKATGIELNDDYAATAKLRILRYDDWLSDQDAVSQDDVADSIPIISP